MSLNTSFYKYNADMISDSDGSGAGDGDGDDAKINVTNEYFLLISNSKDRNYTSGQDTFKYYTDFSNSNYKNIVSISVLGVLMPNLYLNLNELHGLYDDSIITSSNSAGVDSKIIKQRQILDLNYIHLNVSNLEGNITGSNNEMTKSSCVLIADSHKELSNNSGGYEPSANFEAIEVGNIGNHVLANTSNATVYFKNIVPWEKKYSTPIGSLNNINFSFTDPYGTPLTLMNDHLTISTISADGSPVTNLKLVITEYFSPEEYKIGDTIIIKDTLLNDHATVSIGNLQRFINRPEGHSIIGLSGINTNTHLYNTITIPFEYSINKTSGASSKVDYNITSSIILTPSRAGTLINTSIQNIIFLKIGLHRNENKFLASRII
jgi:hypothetical protein